MTESRDHTIKRAAAILAIAAAALTLTGCQQTEESLKRDARFAQECHENGGRVYYVGWADDQIRCTFEGIGK